MHPKTLNTCPFLALAYTHLELLTVFAISTPYPSRSLIDVGAGIVPGYGLFDERSAAEDRRGSVGVTV